VADKFHVVRAASGALNSIRIAKGKAAETKTRKKATYRGRHILLKRPSNLTAKQAFALDGMLANDADRSCASRAGARVGATRTTGSEAAQHRMRP
ncbi:transposase, partial [Staphylococcus aureus]